MAVVGRDHSLSGLNAVYTGFYRASLPHVLPPESFYFRLFLGKPFIGQFPTRSPVAPPGPSCGSGAPAPAPKPRHDARQVRWDQRSSRDTPKGTRGQAQHPSAHTQRPAQRCSPGAEKPPNTTSRSRGTSAPPAFFSCGSRHGSTCAISLIDPGQPRGAHRHSGWVPGTPRRAPRPEATAIPGAPGHTPLCRRGCPGSQTGVETRVEQVGQSHAGHGRAVTATGFPQPCPGQDTSPFPASA